MAAVRLPAKLLITIDRNEWRYGLSNVGRAGKQPAVATRQGRRASACATKRLRGCGRSCRRCGRQGPSQCLGPDVRPGEHLHLRVIWQIADQGQPFAQLQRLWCTGVRTWPSCRWLLLGKECADSSDRRNLLPQRRGGNGSYAKPIVSAARCPRGPGCPRPAVHASRGRTKTGRTDSGSGSSCNSPGGSPRPRRTLRPARSA